MAQGRKVASELSGKPQHSQGSGKQSSATLMLGCPLVDAAPHSKAGSSRSTPQSFWRFPSEGFCYNWMVPSANTPEDKLEKKPWSNIPGSDIPDGPLLMNPVIITNMHETFR